MAPIFLRVTISCLLVFFASSGWSESFDERLKQEGYESFGKNKCGVYAAYLYLSYFNRSVSVESIDQKLPKKERGISLAAIKQFLIGEGFSVQAKKGSVEDFLAGASPGILVLHAPGEKEKPPETHHFSFAIPDGKRATITIIDPLLADGQEIVTPGILLHSWSGIYLVAK